VCALPNGGTKRHTSLYIYRLELIYLTIVTDRVEWSVGRSVRQSVSHIYSEPCKNGCTDRDAVWVEDLGGPKEPCIRRGPDPHGKGQF